MADQPFRNTTRRSGDHADWPGDPAMRPTSSRVDHIVREPVQQPSFGGCAYCLRKRVLWFTGRRWICRECFREHLGGEPTDG
jgi:hypothetical protein